ncbi:MAG: hypothetical protein R6V85_19070 [Polyangia bacterium]
MTQMSSPGLEISPRVVFSRWRRLPVEGELLASVGDDVEADDVVARADLPGPLHPVRAAGALGIPRAELPRRTVVEEGDAVEERQLLASSRALWGLLRSEVRAPMSGIVESISDVTGQIVLRAAPRPIELRAYLGGKVTGVEPGRAVEIETSSSLVQGIVGLGSETAGEVAVLAGGEGGTLGAGAVRSEHAGAVVVARGGISAEAVDRLREVGAAAVVAGGIGGDDLVRIAGREPNIAATGDERIGLTLILTEGFGDLEMSRRAFAVLSGLEGKRVSACGTTQVRAGVVRPEVIGPPLQGEASTPSREAALGVRVRVVRGRRFGATGIVEAIPERPVELPTGARALAYEVKLDDGERTLVPRANAELV